MIKRYKKPEAWLGCYGETYECNHPLYNVCTVYFRDGIGFAVIQQKFVPKSKITLWGNLDPWLADDIYLNKHFNKFFKEYAKPKDANGLFPTITVRQLMRKLHMPPMEKQYWETRF